jgi:hypothetical protein
MSAWLVPDGRVGFEISFASERDVAIFAEFGWPPPHPAIRACEVVGVGGRRSAIIHLGSFRGSPGHSTFGYCAQSRQQPAAEPLLPKGWMPMRRAGQDSRHDKDGVISRTYGNMLITTLREIHGPDFAIGFDGNEKLNHTLERLDQKSLAHLGECR